MPTRFLRGIHFTGTYTRYAPLRAVMQRTRKRPKIQDDKPIDDAVRVPLTSETVSNVLCVSPTPLIDLLINGRLYRRHEWVLVRVHKLDF